MTAAEQLRAKVVMAVLFAVIGLAYGLFILIGALYVLGREVDSALWGAAGIYGGALVTWLVNSKGQDQQPTPVEVVQPEGQPVPVQYEADLP